MNDLLIYIWVSVAMLSMSVWEASAEGRKAWDKGKCGFKIYLPFIGVYSMYHVFIVFVMLPMLIIGLPLIITGWNLHLFGLLLSALITGLVIEDFGWYVFNPKVGLKELWTPFSDYYPWIRIGKQKILPTFYVIGIITAAIILYIT